MTADVVVKRMVDARTNLGSLLARKISFASSIQIEKARTIVDGLVDASLTEKGIKLTEESRKQMLLVMFAPKDSILASINAEIELVKAELDCAEYEFGLLKMEESVGAPPF